MTPEGPAGPGGEFPGWQPVVEETADAVPAGAAAALHGLLDAPGSAPRSGDPLPPLWHWLAFLPRVPQAQLGADGHPHRGAFMPPVSLPRRMFAGGRLSFRETLGVGTPIGRRATVDSVETKQGRTGPLTFVAVSYQYYDDQSPGDRSPADDSGGDLRGEPAIDEDQDIVYRDMPPVTGRSAVAGRDTASSDTAGSRAPGGAASPTATVAPDGPADDRWQWGFDLPVDSTLLFRFSALTYNAHRIHYDRAYATEVEGYPGLVVHGPLQAIALAELCRRNLGDHRMTTFRFRAMAPAFDDGPVLLRGGPDPASDRSDGSDVSDGSGVAGTVLLMAFDHSGRPTMEARATLAGHPLVS